MTRDTPLPSLAVLETEAVVEIDGSEELPPRQCGRCRMMFEGDPTLDVRLRNEWCLCPACDAILLPAGARARARRANVIALRRPSVISAELPADER